MIRKALAISGLVILAATAVEAGTHGRGHARHGKGHGERQAMMKHRMAEKLNLTQEQREAIRAIRERAREETADLRSSLRERSKELRQLQRDDPRAAQLRSDVQALREQMQQRHEAVRAEVERLLTPEQKQQLEQWKEQRQNRRRK